MSLRRATQEELQRRPSPVAETPPLQRRPSVRAVIRTVSAGRGPSQAEPIPEAEESQTPGLAGTAGSPDPASPDLGPRGPELASLQAERDVVSGVGLGLEAGPAVGSESQLLGVGLCWGAVGVSDSSGSGRQRLEYGDRAWQQRA